MKSYKAFRWLAAFVFLSALAFPQLVTVHSKIGLGSGTAAKGKNYLHFDLYNCGPNWPVQVDSSGAVQTVVSRTFDVLADSTGLAAGTVVPNDQITCGNVASTEWRVSVLSAQGSPIAGPKRFFICSAAASGRPCAQLAGAGGIFDVSSAQIARDDPAQPGWIQLLSNPTTDQYWTQPIGKTAYFLGHFDFSGATVSGLAAGGAGGATSWGSITGTLSAQTDLWNALSQMGGGGGGGLASFSVGTTSTGQPGSNAAVVNVGTPTNVILNFTVPQGANGVGAAGPSGPAGQGATISAGSTTTGTPGSNAAVTNAGTSSAAVFNFTIPAGQTGMTGASGPGGPAGQGATISVGSTTTGTPGSNAAVTNSGTSSTAVFNFTIPAGAAGAQGNPGPIGPSGGTINWRGAWQDSPTSYTAPLDSVSYNGSSYAALANSTGQKPCLIDPCDVNDTTHVNSAYWEILAVAGIPGSSATVAVGSTTTGAAGTNASVTNAGTSSAAVFNFTIPRGATGATGPSGSAGSAATVSVGSTTTGAAGSNALVSNVGSSSAAVFNFTIPAGQNGSQGIQGIQGLPGVGIQGPAGQPGASGNPGLGLPAGGTPGTILVKNSATDYDTGWTGTGATQVNAVKWSATSVTVPTGYDYSLGVGSDSVFKCQLASGSSCMPAAIALGAVPNPGANGIVVCTGTLCSTSSVTPAPATKAAASTKFLTAYDATTGAFTNGAIAATDLPGTLSSGTAITNATLTTPSIGAATGTSVTLGTDGSAAGTLSVANGAGGGAHTLWTSGATTTNTVAGPATVPTTGHLLDCTTASTTCTLHDSGVTTANVVNASSPGLGIAHFAGSTQTITSSLIVAADITSATITGTQLASSLALTTPNIGAATYTSLASSTTCAADGSAAATSIVTCSAAPTGTFSCDPAATGNLCTINTTAALTNSKIFIQPTEVGGGLTGCSSAADTALTKPRLHAIVNGTSFTINLGTFATKLCFDYSIVN